MLTYAGHMLNPLTCVCAHTACECCKLLQQDIYKINVLMHILYITKVHMQHSTHICHTWTDLHMENVTTETGRRGHTSQFKRMPTHAHMHTRTHERTHTHTVHTHLYIPHTYTTHTYKCTHLPHTTRACTHTQSNVLQSLFIYPTLCAFYSSISSHSRHTQISV